MKNHYTAKQYEELLKNVRVVCQTNEQKNEHILQWFEANGIEYVNRSIPEGDYSLMIKACPELGFLMDTYFFDEIFIERKNSLDELARSLCGSKDLPAYAGAVIKELKKEGAFSGYKMAKITKDMRDSLGYYDDAFMRELKRAINKPYKFLLVEQPDGWEGILEHNYKSEYNPKSFWGMLHTIEIKYGVTIKFIAKENMGLEIYSILKSILNSTIAKG